MRLFKPFLLLTLLGMCLYILFFEPEWLGINLFKKSAFPLGTLISWFIIFDFSLLVYWLLPKKITMKSGKIYKILSQFLIVISFFWGVLSYILCGNWSWNFDNKNHFYTWIISTAILIFAQLFLLFILIFKRIFKKEFSV